MVYAVARDVTERREQEVSRERLQSKLIAAERMASVGRLAVGIAHEINNPLSYVMSNVRFALEAVQDEGEKALSRAELVGPLSDALEGAERIRKTVRALGSFAPLRTQRREIVTLATLLQESITRLGGQVLCRARIHEAHAPTPPVEVDPASLSEVFTNLLLNAAQAFTRDAPELNEIRITSFGSPSGGHAVVEIEDNGVGIPPQSLKRIFEPFFTTRDVGAGSGLGLTLCHNAVVELGGSIEVKSEPGRGTTVRVVLPAAVVR